VNLKGSRKEGGRDLNDKRRTVRGKEGVKPLQERTKFPNELFYGDMKPIFTQRMRRAPKKKKRGQFYLCSKSPRGPCKIN